MRFPSQFVYMTLPDQAERTATRLKLVDVPPFPAVAIRALQLVSKSETRLSELHDLICTDPAFAGEILRLANSPLYGIRTKITSAGDRYAIPQVSLLELVRLEAEQARKGIELVHGTPVYRLRGHLLPLVYLKRELKVGAAAHASGHSPLPENSHNELLDFSLARKAHKDWLNRLHKVLDGNTTMTVEEAGSHKLCALGKWIYSSGLQDYGDVAEMRTLEARHQEFHDLVRNIVSLKADGDQTNAERRFREVASRPPPRSSSC